MKFRSAFTLLATGAVLASCSSLGKMQKCAPYVKYSVSPSPLETKGDKVNLDLTITYPKKYFDKRAQLTYTPVLKHDGDEIPFESFKVQGKEYPGNAQSVDYKSGGTAKYSAVLDYTPAMEKTDLLLKYDGVKGKKRKTFKAEKIDVGVINTPYLAQDEMQLLPAPSNYKYINEYDYEAIINFLVNSSSVRSSELRDEDIVKLKELIAEAKDNDDYRLLGATILAFASPEGEFSKNTNLAKDRVIAAQRSMESLLKQKRLKVADDFFYLDPKGEDWDGFTKLMEASDLVDKEIIVRIVNMYDDVDKREQEIRNLAATFEEVAEEILPKLRRSELIVKYEVKGKTEAEIKELAKNNLNELTDNEVFRAVEMAESNDEKLRILKFAKEKFKEDFRGYHNTGNVYHSLGQESQAKAEYERALKIEENAFTRNNLGIMAHNNQERTLAVEQLKLAQSAGAKAVENLAIAEIAAGDYNSAVTHFGDAKTFNAALAQILSGNAQKGLTTLESVKEDYKGYTAYLGAVAAARQDKVELVVEKLTEAIGLNPSLSLKAAQDREFYKFKDNEALKAITR